MVAMRSYLVLSSFRLIAGLTTIYVLECAGCCLSAGGRMNIISDWSE